MGVEGFEVMLELMSICLGLGDNAPFEVYPQGRQWLACEKRKRRDGGVAGDHRTPRLEPVRVRVTLGKNRGSKRLAALVLSAHDVQQQGRWKSPAVGMYI